MDFVPKAKMDKQEVYETVARGLREFGYQDVTAVMVREVHEAILEGKSGSALPFGVIGMFAEGQLKEAGLIGDEGDCDA